MIRTNTQDSMILHVLPSINAAPLPLSMTSLPKKTINKNLLTTANNSTNFEKSNIQRKYRKVALSRVKFTLTAIYKQLTVWAGLYDPGCVLAVDHLRFASIAMQVSCICKAGIWRSSPGRCGKGSTFIPELPTSNMSNSKVL